MSKAWIYFLVVLVYSVGVWKVAAKYTNANWLAEKVIVQETIAAEKTKRQELAQAIGTQLESKLQKMQVVNKTINQEIIRETIKEPVYRDCITTPDGVRLIERAIDNK